MIHAFKLNNYNIIVDAASGSVHSVDGAAFDVIKAIDEGRNPAEAAEKHNLGEAELSELLADIEELKKNGQLWSEDIFEEAASEMKIKQSVLKAICLHVAHGCNMDCEYCFCRIHRSQDPLDARERA